MFKQILFSGIFFLLLIFLGEIFTRAFLVNHNTIDVWGFNNGGYGDLLPNRNFVAEVQPELPYRLITNTQGLRADTDYSVPKSEGTFRILAVGDSITFGPFVNNFQTYPAQVEKYLKNEKSNVEVINAGISGYTLEDESNYLNEKGLKLQPDLILIGVFENDVSDYLKNKRQVFSRASHQQIPGWKNILITLAKKSAMITYTQTKMAAKQAPALQKIETQTIDYSPQLEQYFQDLNRLDNLVKEKNLKVVFLLIPSFEQAKGDKDYFPQYHIGEKLTEMQYPYLDLLPIFQQLKVDDLYLMPQTDIYLFMGIV